MSLLVIARCKHPPLRTTGIRDISIVRGATTAAGDHPQVNYKFKIMEARLFIRTMHISPSLILCQERGLQPKNYSIPFNKVITNTLTIPTGTSQIEFDKVYLGKLPDVVILPMVSDTDISGGYQENPFHFQNFGPNYLSIQANGKQIIREAYQPNFANRDSISCYLGVIEGLGFDLGPNCWDLTREEWL